MIHVTELILGCASAWPRPFTPNLAPRSQTSGGRYRAGCGLLTQPQCSPCLRRWPLSLAVKKRPRREGVPCGAQSRAGPTLDVRKVGLGKPNRVRARTPKPDLGGRAKSRDEPRPDRRSKYRTTSKYQGISASAGA